MSALALSCAPPPQYYAEPVQQPVTPPPKAPPPAPAAPLEVTGAGSILEQVTSEPVDEAFPSISGDGKILLFEVFIQVDQSPELKQELEQANADILARQSRLEKPLNENEAAAIKKDLMALRQFKTMALVGRPRKQQTLVAVDPQTRAQRTLYTSTNSLSSDPAWLPDQTSFVYASNSPGNWSLVRALTAAPNAAVRVIASGDIAPMASSPSISPDGTQVAFTVVVRGTPKLSVINLDGSRFTQLGDGDRPAWSPDGKLLAFARQVGENVQIFTVNPATGTELTQVTSGPFDHRAPAWSPDSRRVVFSTDRGAKPGSVALNLYAINKDGTGLTQLTTGDALNISPEWGKDNWIYFAAYQGDNFDIWRMKLAAEGK